MRRRSGSLFLRSILAATALAWQIPQAGAQNRVEVEYVEPADPAFAAIFKDLRDRRVLEELREFLSPLRLPSTLAIRTEQCGDAIRPYRPGAPISICYEYVARLVELAIRIPREARTQRGVSRGDAIVGAFIQTVLQQSASAVFDILDLPVWGREQDAADKLAAFLMLQFGLETSRKVLNGAAYFFEASDRSWTGSDFSDVRSTEAQRFYNYLCIAYGSDAKAFSGFVEGIGRGGGPARVDLLPARRAARCAEEYDDFRWAFTSLILPHVDPERLLKVRATDWLRYSRRR
jgi:hypothetical protein